MLTQQRKPRLLFVDDSVILIRTLQRLFEKQSQDWDIEFTNCPLAALEMATRQVFDIVVADQGMPDLTGLELLASIHEKSPATTGYLLTGGMTPDEEQQARRRALRVVEKPFDTNDLKEEMRAAIERRQETQSEGVTNEDTRNIQTVGR